MIFAQVVPLPEHRQGCLEETNRILSYLKYILIPHTQIVLHRFKSKHETIS